MALLHTENSCTFYTKSFISADKSTTTFFCVYINNKNIIDYFDGLSQAILFERSSISMTQSLNLTKNQQFVNLYFPCTNIERYKLTTEKQLFIAFSAQCSTKITFKRDGLDSQFKREKNTKFGEVLLSFMPCE